MSHAAYSCTPAWLLLCGFAFGITSGHVHYPDPRLTPGVAASSVNACEKLPARHVSQALKRRVCRAYGINTDCPGPAWEIDALIPYELGGLGVIANLWPQPIGEARIKDKLAKLLRRAVCAGRLSLGDAQACIVADWYTCWQCWDPERCPMGRGLNEAQDGNEHKPRASQ